MFYWKILSEDRPLTVAEKKIVIILVLLEDTLRAAYDTRLAELMPQSHNPCFIGRYSQSEKHVSVLATSETVLILVLLEDTLREHVLIRQRSASRHNPCFIGRYSQSLHRLPKKAMKSTSHNPCFIGRYSQSDLATASRMMNIRHNPCFIGRYSQRIWK